MTNYRCKKGCKKPNGNPEYHDSKKQCRSEAEFDPGWRPKSAPAPLPVAPTVAPMSGTPAPGGSASPVSAPTPRPAGIIGTLGLSDARAAVPPPNAPAPTPQAQTWVLDEDHNSTFWHSAASVLQRITGFAVRFLGSQDDPEIKERLATGFRINPADEQLMKGAPRRLATSLLKQAGNATLEEAQNMVDGIGFIMFMGGMVVTVIEIGWRAYEVSPRFAEQREAKKQAEAEKVAKLKEQGDTKRRTLLGGAPSAA